MTEQEWLVSTDPQRMLQWLQGDRTKEAREFIHPLNEGLVSEWVPSRISERKLRLFACACCRQVWDGEECNVCKGRKKIGCGVEIVGPGRSRPKFRDCSPCKGTGRIGGLTDPRSRKAVEVAERYADEGESLAKKMGRAWLYLDMEAPHEPSWMFAYLSCCPPDTLARDLINSAFTAFDLILPATQAALLRDIVGNPWRLWMRESAFVAGAVILGPKLNIVWESWLRWNNGTVLRLAQEIYGEKCSRCDGDGQAHGADRPFEWTGPGTYPGPCPVCHGSGHKPFNPSLLPLLGDALEDAGCTDVEILNHCRGLERCGCKGQSYDPHTREMTCPCDGEGWRTLRGPHVKGCWVVDLLLGKE